jgi:hypothetical protein
MNKIYFHKLCPFDLGIPKIKKYNSFKKSLVLNYHPNKKIKQNK